MSFETRVECGLNQCGVPLMPADKERSSGRSRRHLPKRTLAHAPHAILQRINEIKQNFA